jgi:hypothetical protein
VTPENLKQLSDYITEILTSFKHAYRQKAKGQSEAAVMIQFDIWAAGNPLNLSKDRINAHRAAVKSGMEAVDAGIPFALAESRMRDQLSDLVAETLKGWSDEADA